jgi:hypothetical protein
VITIIYVYDANIKAGIIDLVSTINAYRIVYTKNGIKPLSRLQKKLAYGMILLDANPTYSNYDLL